MLREEGVLEIIRDGAPKKLYLGTTGGAKDSTLKNRKSAGQGREREVRIILCCHII